MLPEGSSPSWRASRAPTRPSWACSRIAPPTTIVICALDNLGKGAAGQAVQNANLALGLDRDARPEAARSPGLSVTAAKGFVACGVPPGSAGRPPGSRDRALACQPPVAGHVHRNQVQAACLIVYREHLALAEPQAVVINSGVANAATGQRGKLDALATAAEAARLLDLTPRRCSSSRPA